MGSLTRMLGIVAMFAIVVGVVLSFIIYYINVNTLYNNQYKQYMYYGSNLGQARMNGVSFENVDSLYNVTCDVNKPECDPVNPEYEMLEKALVKYISMANNVDTAVEYKVYVNPVTNELFVTLTSGDVTTTQKIEIGEQINE